MCEKPLKILNNTNTIQKFENDCLRVNFKSSEGSFLSKDASNYTWPISSFSALRDIEHHTERTCSNLKMIATQPRPRQDQEEFNLRLEFSHDLA